MKYKYGEYVRSLVNGKISKVLEISDLLEEPNIKYYKTGTFTGFCSTELYNVKHSPNLIDLIECGDYVNGYKVEKNIYGDLYRGYVWAGGDIGKTLEPYATFIKDTKAEDIESIVTKEQFKRMEYRL